MKLGWKGLACAALLAACGGNKSSATETPTPAASTGSSAEEGTHVMPDGTVMKGHAHPGGHEGHDHDGDSDEAADEGGTHVMPDGTVMKGSHHHEGHEGHGSGTHVMPDGGVMHGEHHTDGPTHVMPDGTIMPGAYHGAPTPKTPAPKK